MTTREEGARVQVLSSFAKPDKTNEQTKARKVVPLEVPHDTRICSKDLVDTNFDKSDADELRDEKESKTARFRDPRTREETNS